MIIWGSKGKTKTIGNGNFYCPNCKSHCHFKLERVSKYFTLYFIPLFETKKLGEYVECQTCFMTFKPEVLQFSRQLENEIETDRKITELVSKIASELDSGVPIQAVMRGLVDAGCSEETASKIIYAATKGDYKQCSQCGLSYKSSITFCSTCGSRLKLLRD